MNIDEILNRVWDHTGDGSLYESLKAKLRAADALVTQIKNDGSKLKDWSLVDTYERAGKGGGE